MSGQEGLYTLGIDFGTTSTKGVVLNQNLDVIAKARTYHGVDNPRPGFAEQDADIWWSDLRDIVNLLSRKVDPTMLSAVGISSMCPTVLPVSKEGKALRSSILYGIDMRAVNEYDWLNKELGEDFKEHIYTRYTSQSILPKILWIKRNEKEIFNKCAKFLTSSGYIVYKLTGRFTIDMFSASAGNLVDLTDLGWYSRALKLAEIDEELLPEILWSSELAGTVSAEASAYTCLPEGIPVTVGMCDAAAEALICSSILPGNTAVSLGGTTLCVTCTKELQQLDKLFVNTHLFSGSFMYGGATGSGGILLEWFAKNILHTSTDEMFEEYSDLKYRPTSCLFLPYLNGARTPLNDSNARGLFTGLAVDTGREDLYITLLESLAFDLADMLSEITKSRTEINQLHFSGGGTKNRLLMQIIAEVLERDLVVVDDSLDAASGAAILAFIGMKVFEIGDMNSVIPGNIIRYKGDFKTYFSKKRILFSKLYKANKTMFAEMGTILGEL